MEQFQKYIDYIKNTGGHPNVEWFVSDWEPIGETVLKDMEKAGVIRILDGKVWLLD